MSKNNTGNTSEKYTYILSHYTEVRRSCSTKLGLMIEEVRAIIDKIRNFQGFGGRKPTSLNR